MATTFGHLEELSPEKFKKNMRQTIERLDEIDEENASILLEQEELNKAIERKPPTLNRENSPPPPRTLPKTNRGDVKEPTVAPEPDANLIDGIDKDNEQLLSTPVETPPPVEATPTVQRAPQPTLQRDETVRGKRVIPQEDPGVSEEIQNRAGFSLHRKTNFTLPSGEVVSVGDVEDEANRTKNYDLLKQIPGLYEIYDVNNDGNIDVRDHALTKREKVLGTAATFNPMFMGQNIAEQVTGDRALSGLAAQAVYGFDPNRFSYLYNLRRRSMLNANEYGLRENLGVLKDQADDIGLDLFESIQTAPETQFKVWTGHSDVWNEDDSTNRDYKPSWNLLSGVERAVDKTWWGKPLHTAGEFYVGMRLGGMALRSTVPGITGSMSRSLGFGNRFQLIPSLPLSRWLGAGMHGWFRKDALSEDTIMGTLKKTDNKGWSGVLKKFPFMEPVINALGTADTDNPLLLMFKGAAEEFSIDFEMDHLLRVTKISNESLHWFDDSIINQAGQIKEKALIEQAQLAARQLELPLNQAGQQVYPEPNIRGHLNKPIVEPHQGSPSSTGKALDLHKQLNLIDDLPEGSVGSTASPITPAAAERMATTSGLEPALIKSKASELLSDPRYQELINIAARDGRTVEEVFEGALRRVQEIMGRESTGVEDFWRPIADLPAERLLNQEFWPLEEIVAVDLINGSLFKQLRNTAIFTNEISKAGADIFAVDGSMKTIADRLVVGLTNAKRSRYLWGRAGGMLKKGGDLSLLNSKELAQETAKRTADLHDETVDGVRLMMQLMKNSDSDELARAILDVFSQSSKIQNWMDFDNWVRAKIRGGQFDGKHETGALIKELQQMMVYSVLSGPKTPMRAILGTAGNAYMDSVNTLIGATVRQPLGGSAIARKAAAENLSTMVKIVPDAWKVFRSNVDNAFDVDMATIKTRFSGPSPQETNWNVLGEWVEQSADSTWADKAAYRIANLAYKANKNKVFTWSARVLHATDDTFKYIMANARANEQALKEVLEGVDQGLYKEWSPEMLTKAQDNHYKSLLNDAGDIDLTKDIYLQQRFKSATLTEDLQGISKGLEDLFEKVPIMKPWFLFARTGVNGLRVTMKNAPGLSLAMKESRDVLLASADDLANGNLVKYGIDNATDLQQAKDLILGRQVFGSIAVFTAGQMYWNGSLTGNGPADGKLRQAWIDAGWKPRSLRLGDVWVNYDNFEPWNLLLSSVADIGDNQALMGPEWTENHLEAVAFTIGNGLKSKSYLGGLSQLMDVISGKPSAGYGSVIGNLMNNTMPLASLRNHIGKALRPQMLEINGSFWESIRNRNKFMEPLSVGGGIRGKFDVINGRPLGAHPLEWFSDTFLPFGLSLAKGPGRTMLWNSNYDLRLSSYTLPTPYGNISLADSPQIRSMLQEAIGSPQLEAELDALARRPDVQASIRLMNNDRKNGLDMTEPRRYAHNKLIKELFTRHRRRAAASLLDRPEVQNLIREYQEGLINNQRASDASSATTYYNRLGGGTERTPDRILNLPVK